MKPFAFVAAWAALSSPLGWAAPDAADPAAPAPRVQYRSVFQDTPTGVEADAQDWKKANAEVGRFPRGHADLIKWEEQARPPDAQTPPQHPMPHGPMHRQMHNHNGGHAK